MFKNYVEGIYQFLLKLIKSPFSEIQEQYHLNWKNILIYFCSVSLIANLALVILTAIAAFSMSIIMLIYAILIQMFGLFNATVTIIFSTIFIFIITIRAFKDSLILPAVQR